MPNSDSTSIDQSSSSATQRLIIGCGYLGRRVARRWVEQGDTVYALTRSASNAEQLKSLGVEPILGDVTQLDSLSSLPAVETVLHAVGFDRTAQPTKREVYVEGLQNVLSVMADRCQRFLYVSSTSVYGQQDEEVVDESSSCEPTTESGQICRAAEQLVESTTDTTGMILRLSGIYGPDRLLSRVEAIQAGLSLPGPKDAWLNLIHVDDAAAVVCYMAEQADESTSEKLLLVTDNEPIRRHQYYETLAAGLNAPIPQFDEHATARHTRGKSKRCDNGRLRRLGIELDYPTFEAGIRHALDETL